MPMVAGDEYFRTPSYEQHVIIATKTAGEDAEVVIERDGAQVRRFLYPAYKVWNLEAHYTEIIDSQIEGDQAGMLAAGTDLLGGHVMPREIASDH